jgi:hypothetical protein
MTNISHLVLLIAKIRQICYIEIEILLFFFLYIFLLTKEELFEHLTIPNVCNLPSHTHKVINRNESLE